MNLRILLTLAFFAVGIAVMYGLQGIYGGLTAVLVGSLFFLFALALWTLPSGTFQRGLKLDPMQRRVVGAFLGIGWGRCRLVFPPRAARRLGVEFVPQ